MPLTESLADLVPEDSLREVETQLRTVKLMIKIAQAKRKALGIVQGQLEGISSAVAAKSSEADTSKYLDPLGLSSG